MVDQRKRKPSKRRAKAPSAVSDVYAPLTTAATEPANVIPIRAGRNREHPHVPVAGGGRDAGDLKRYHTKEDDLNLRRHFDAQRGQNHRAALARSLEMLPPEMRRAEPEIFEEQMGLVPSAAPDGSGRALTIPEREQLAATAAHKAMAAAIMSVGGTLVEAAMHAGVHPSTAAKYARDPEFIAEVNANRRRLMSRVQGGALAEIERRVFSGDVLFMETKDVLEVIKRTSDLGGDETLKPREKTTAAGHNGPSVNIYNQLAAIAAPAPQQAIAGRVADDGPTDPIEGTFTVPEDRDIPLLGLVGDSVAEGVPQEHS